MPFLKACFNCEGDSDGLLFIVGAGVFFLATVICENLFEIKRVTKASFEAEKVLRDFFEKEDTIILQNATIFQEK